MWRGEKKTPDLGVPFGGVVRSVFLWYCAQLCSRTREAIYALGWDGSM